MFNAILECSVFLFGQHEVKREDKSKIFLRKNVELPFNPFSATGKNKYLFIEVDGASVNFHVNYVNWDEISGKFTLHLVSSSEDAETHARRVNLFKNDSRYEDCSY